LFLSDVMPSIHDSLLYAYEVDGDRRTIVLHTRQHPGGGTDYIDVIFRGVQAYHFEGDCLNNIVFSIDEVPASTVIGDGVACYERNRQYGWPNGWDSRRETLEEFFSRCNCRIFEITTSYGMYGFVAAASMEQQISAAPT
jgi:hypothetical protein